MRPLATGVLQRFVCCVVGYSYVSVLCGAVATRQSQTADSAPGVATREVTLSARKVVPCLQLVLLCTVYSRAQGCVCTVLQLGGDVEQPWLMSKYDVVRETGIT